jgi:hypothetical protein
VFLVNGEGAERVPEPAGVLYLYSVLLYPNHVFVVGGKGAEYVPEPVGVLYLLLYLTLISI